MSRVLDGLFVARDTETGDLAAIELRPGVGKGDGLARVLTFRLDARARRGTTERILAGSGSVPAYVVQAIGRSLTTGGAVLALLIDQPSWEHLDDAVARTGGRMLSAAAVRGSSLAELAPLLLAAAQNLSDS